MAKKVIAKIILVETDAAEFSETSLEIIGKAVERTLGFNVEALGLGYSISEWADM